MGKKVGYYDENWNSVDYTNSWTWRLCYTPNSSRGNIIGSLSILKRVEEFSDSIDIRNPKNPDLPDYLPDSAKEKIKKELMKNGKRT